jgi:pentatricopeptide repeat protein
MITFASVAISLTVGLLLINFAHGQESNTTQQREQNHTGTLMKYKGEVYCYDETTTTKKEVLDAIKHDRINAVTESENGIFGGMVENGDFDLAEELCQSMVEDGNIPNESYHDKGIELDSTLTLELK